MAPPVSANDPGQGTMNAALLRWTLVDARRLGTTEELLSSFGAMLVDAGARVALATDCNPGSSMTTNLALALQIAVLMARLTPPEALRGVTRTAALALDQVDGLTGRIAVGERFESTLLDLTHPDALFYAFAAPPRAHPLVADTLHAASVASRVSVQNRR